MMKQIYLCLLLSLVCFGALSAQEGCTAYFPFTEGAEMTYGYYDKKEKLDGSAVHKITEVSEAADGLEATIEMTQLDKKGKEAYTGTYDVQCTDKVFSVDVTAMMSPQMTQSFSTMDFNVSGDAMQIPENLTVGMELPDANNEIKAGSGGVTIMTINYSVTDRKVEAKEEITTPAGTFECYKVTSTFDMKATLINRTFQNVDWIAPGVGMVKQETYDKKGKLISKTQLLDFEAG